MTLTEFSDMIFNKWQTIIVIDDSYHNCFLEALENGEKLNRILAETFECYISIAPFGAYKLDAILKREYAESKIRHLHIEDAFIVAFVELAEVSE